MRAWRPLHKGFTSSDKIASVSDGAALLFTFLIAHQDDAARFPWTPTRVRALIASRTWTLPQAHAFLSELISAGLMSVQGQYGVSTPVSIPYFGLVEIVGGVAKAGPPKSGSREHREPRFYETPSLTPDSKYGVSTASVQRQSYRTEQNRRGEDLKTPHPTPTAVVKRRTPLPITEDYKAALVEEFSAALGGAQAVRDAIEEALNHKAMDKRKDKRLYLRAWLRKEGRQRSGVGRQGLRIGMDGKPYRDFDNSPQKYAEEAKHDI